MSLLKPGKLVEFSPTFFATRAAYYNQPCRDFTRSNVDDLREPISQIETELNLSGHRFILKALKPLYNGLTMPTISVAYIDPRREVQRLIYTICHEALHLRQVQDKRLEWDKKHRGIIWEGQLFQISELSDCEDNWKQLPWEIDVFEKEVELYRKVTGRIRLPKHIRLVK